MTLPFHPIADTFPLIEGHEFDELVASIKENGLREKITILGGAILDGRNRYRACIKAGVEVRSEEFDGSDPVSFVVDKNIHRRHLNESQRGLIAARIATLTVGRPHLKTIVGTPTISQTHAGKLLNVSRETVLNAKRVLEQGTPEQIKAVETGQAAVSTTADKIRGKAPPKKRPRSQLPRAMVGKNPERIENRRIRAQLWAQLRDALDALTGLPMPSEVLPIIRENDRKNTIPSKLPKALKWLKEFSDAWGNRDQAAA